MVLGYFRETTVHSLSVGSGSVCDAHHLYGCENWIWSEELLKSFQGEMGKRILKVAKCTSNTTVGVVMGWPSIWARVLVRKMSFLQRLVLGDGSS